MRSAILAALVALGLHVPVLTAQQPAMPRGHPPMTPGAGMNARMMAMDSLNQRLDSLVARMNQASGTQKVDAMAAVINELVNQRKAMHDRMQQMMQGHAGAEPMYHGGMPPAGHRGPPGATPAPSDSTGRPAQPQK